METTPDIELPLDEAQGFVLEGEVAVDADGSPETPADLVFLSEDDSVSTPGAQAPGGGEAELIDGGLAAAEAEPESADLARYAEDRARAPLSARDRVAGHPPLEDGPRPHEGSGPRAPAPKRGDAGGGGAGRPTGAAPRPRPPSRSRFRPGLRFRSWNWLGSCSASRPARGS